MGIVRALLTGTVGRAEKRLFNRHTMGLKDSFMVLPMLLSPLGKGENFEKLVAVTRSTYCYFPRRFTQTTMSD